MSDRMGGVYRPSKAKAPRSCKACGSILVADKHGRLCPQSGCAWRWTRRKGWTGPPKVRAKRVPFVVAEQGKSLKGRCPKHGLQFERRYDQLRVRIVETCPLNNCPHGEEPRSPEIPESYTWEHPSMT